MLHLKSQLSINNPNLLESKLEPKGQPKRKLKHNKNIIPQQVNQIHDEVLVKKSSLRVMPLGALLLAGLSSLSPLVTAQQTMPITPKELPIVKVQADAEQPDGMRSSITRIGKVLQDPHQVPQAVTTITNSVMQEQQVGSLREALRNVSGLSFNAAEGGRSGDNMNLRGFYTFGDMYLDGIRDTAQYSRESFNLERIDVLRGVGATLFGRGQAGGVINQVSKTPMRFDQYKVSGSIGSYGYSEAKADLNKSINDRTALRINAMQRDEGSWRSNPTTGAEPEIHRKGFAMSLGLNLYTDNQFWLNYYRLKTNDNPDYGISFDTATKAPGKILPTHYFWGNRGTFDNTDTSISTLVNEYKISADSQLRSQLRLADYDRSYWAKTPNLTTPPDLLGSIGKNKIRASHYKTLTLQSDYSTKVQLGEMKHELLAGIEYLKEENSRKSLQNFGTNDAPDFRPYQDDPAENPTQFKGNSYAVYAQDSIELIPQWRTTMGIRRDQMDATYSSQTSPQLKYGENSYRAALSYQPASNTHYYLTWSNAFSPTADLYQRTVTSLPPERSDVIELGAKWLVLDGDLALRAALYQATKRWERNADLESLGTVLTKKRRTNGFELEAAGRLNKNWEVFAGVALMDAKVLEVAENINPTTGLITSANPEYVGKRARNTPPYTFNLWSTYQLNSRWKIGGGIEAKGTREAVKFYTDAAAPTYAGIYYPNTAPAYARWDAMVAYQYEKWTLRMNVKNLLNALYYDSVYDNGSFTVPGTQRRVNLTAEYKF